MVIVWANSSLLSEIESANIRRACSITKYDFDLSSLWLSYMRLLRELSVFRSLSYTSEIVKYSLKTLKVNQINGLTLTGRKLSS